MKRLSTLLTIIAACVVVCFACGLVMAAQAADEQAPSKPDAAPADTQDTGEAAEAAEPASKEPSLEKRLESLLDAVDKATKTRSHTITSDIKTLAALLPEKEKGLINPESGNPIILNKELQGKDDRGITNPATVICFYADSPTPDKGRAAIFCDGKIKYLTEEALKKSLEEAKVKKMTREQLQVYFEDQRAERMERAAQARAQRSSKKPPATKKK